MMQIDYLIGYLARAGVLLLALAATLAPARTARADEALTLEAAIRRAWEQNSDIRAAEAEVDAARARAAGARAQRLGNPELSIGAGPRFGSGERAPGDRHGSTIDVELSITQPIEIGGRRRARIDAAAASVNVAEARLAELRGAVAADVREAFGRALAAEAHGQVARDAIQLATQALQAAERRQRAGDASLIEVNTARIELGRSQRANLAARRMRAAAIAELKLLLGIGAAAPVALQGQLEPAGQERTVAGQAHTIDLQESIALAARNRADLLVARHELEATRAEQRLASREAVPTPRVGVSFGKEESAQIVLGILSMEIPLFDRNQTARGVSRARVRQAELAVAALEQRIAQEVELSLERVRTAREALEAFSGDVLRALEENVALVTRGYEAGELDFLQLLLIRREMLEARREYIEALAELNSAEAQLDRVLGVPPAPS